MKIHTAKDGTYLGLNRSGYVSDDDYQAFQRSQELRQSSANNPSFLSKGRVGFARSSKAISMAIMVLLGALLINGASAQDYYDPGITDISAAIADMPDVSNNYFDPVKKAAVLERLKGKPFSVTVDSIEPEGGPITGNTRVLVRGGPLQDMETVFQHPKCKFGKFDLVVDATYVMCTQSPTSIESLEPRHRNKNETCLQCDSSPETGDAEIVPFSISLTGDFSDSANSVPYRYYKPTRIFGIYPRYGPKDGQTFVQVWGENFLNFDENTRCNFGSKSVVAHFVSSTYLTCIAPFSDVVEKPIPFSISLNKQQNSKDKFEFWYYNWHSVVELVPNYGPDSGGNRVIIKGNNMMPFIGEDIDATNDTFCEFEGVGKVKAYPINSTKLYCEAPPNFVLDKTFVEVTLNNQQYTDDNVPYYYYRPPQVFDIDPREGPTKGGTEVIIFGNKFKESKNITCKFGEKFTRGVFLDNNRIQCVSPTVERPGYVPLTISYEGERYSSETVKFLYYETPELYNITPTCGPVTGYTQITVFGKNFIDMGFGKVKCIFNNTFVMNATIMESDIIKCDSPPLPPSFGFSEAGGAPWFNISVTLNGKELSESNTTKAIKFTYYIDPSMTSITPNVGPMKGGTVSHILGSGFAQEGVCNVTVRYGTFQQKLANYTDSELVVVSPVAEVPDSVVVSVSLNGQQFINDKTLHFRDIENTFTYSQELFIQDHYPKSGPTSGKTKIKVQGMGFTQFKDEDGTPLPGNLWVRFRDSITGDVVAEPTKAFDVTDEEFSWRTPPADLDTKAVLELSFNKYDWQPVLTTPGQNYSYQYYNAPRIGSVTPSYGPVKSPNNESIDIIGKNFHCPDPECRDLWVRFGDSENGIYVKGEKVSDDRVKAQVPKYTKPDVLNVEITFNGQDYTHDNNTYGFFDPFVLNVKPRLISTKGTTRVRLYGFGFVNATGDLKTKLHHVQRGALQCSGTVCIQMADYVDPVTIETSTYPQREVLIKDNGDNIKLNGMAIEASVTGGSAFTENNIEIWYFEFPDYHALNIQGAPSNKEKPLFVKTDFKWTVNDIDRFNKHGNFTCRFTSPDGKRVVLTQGRMETYPLGAHSEEDLPTHIRCNTPVWKNSEQVKLDISVNGQDFTGDFTFTFYDVLDLYRIVPMSGPNEGKTKVKLLGSGFQNGKDDILTRWGTLETEKIVKDQVLDYIWNEADFIQNSMVPGSEILSAYKKEAYSIEKRDYELSDALRLKTVVSHAPKLPNWNRTNGGQVYMSVGEHLTLNTTRSYFDEQGLSVQESGNQTVYHYSNSLVEYYYYQQPVVKKVEPKSGLTRGGTRIEISGAWFAYKPEYGVVPHCKIGDKVTRARFFSTVRIVCVSAPNDDINQLYPVQVSLNGVDFVDTGFTFRYYEQPTLYKMTPTCGPESGGTQIYISGSKFSNISDPQNFNCRFTSQERDIPPKFIPAFYENQTTIMCSSPGGWGRGDSVKVQVTFNGEDYSDNNFTFNYYNILRAFPRSGPADGSGLPIRIEGSGFRNDTEIYCSLDKVLYEPVEIKPDVIRCPMVKAKQGPTHFGAVDFAIIIDGNWHKFTGGFQYYEQIQLDEMFPHIGPSEGKGIIYFYGKNFRDDYSLADVGCKVGEAIGKGKVVNPNTIKCTIEEMSLVDEGFSLPASVALNSYSFADSNQTFVPYGVTGIYPNSGPYSGNTDILILGKGFTEDLQEKAKCRFGINSNFAIVDAEILSYDKMICRSPPEFKIPATGDQTLSVPLGVGFLDEEFEPWSESIHRFRYYPPPVIVSAQPEEIEVGRMAEVYVFADENSEFWEPIPTAGSKGGVLGQYGIECKFGRFGVGIGMFVNKTTIKCVTPSVNDDPDTIWRETVKLTVAQNGQDFDEETSDVDFTFVGTGSTLVFWPYVIGTLLIGLLLVALIVFCSAFLQKVSFERIVDQKSSSVRRSNRPYVIRDPYDQFTSRAYSAGMMGRSSSSRQGQSM